MTTDVKKVRLKTLTKEGQRDIEKVISGEESDRGPRSLSKRETGLHNCTIKESKKKGSERKRE